MRESSVFLSATSSGERMRETGHGLGRRALRALPTLIVAALVVASCTACGGLRSPSAQDSTQSDRPSLAPTLARTAEGDLATLFRAPAYSGSGGIAGHYLSGRLALIEGDVAQAADSFAQALSLDEANIELRRQVFLLRLAEGDFEAALEHAQRIVDEEASGEDLPVGEAQLLLALDHAKAGDVEQTLEEFEAIMPRGMVGVALPILTAWAEFEAVDADTARAHLTEQDESDGLSLIRTYHLALMNALDGKPDQAAGRLEEVIAETDTVPPRIVQAYLAVQTERGEREAASAFLTGQIEAGGDDSVLLDLRRRLDAGEAIPLPVDNALHGMSDTFFSLAQALGDQNAAAQGLLMARMAEFLTPDEDDITLLLGRLQLSEERYDAAIGTLRGIGDESPHGWTARLLEAEALAESERLDEAVELLDRLAEERPERIDVLVTKGDLLRFAERYAQAEKAYSRALTRAGEPGPADWRLLYSRGITYERTDRWEEAEADLLKALELEPDQPFVLNYLGYSWVDQGLHLDRALEMLETAVELRPDDGFIVDSLGWAHYRLGNYDKAVRELERAIELQPGDPTINDHLGDAYWRAGREREARFQWERALVFEPEEEELIAEIERKLENGLPKTPPSDRG